MLARIHACVLLSKRAPTVQPLVAASVVGAAMGVRSCRLLVRARLRELPASSCASAS